MTINSETTLHRATGHGVVEEFVELDLDSFSSPETYDPTTKSGTTAGQKRLDSLLGASVIDVDGSVDVTYDAGSNDLHAASQDGTAAPSNVTVRLRLVGERGP